MGGRTSAYFVWLDIYSERNYMSVMEREIDMVEGGSGEEKGDGGRGA